MSEPVKALTPAEVVRRQSKEHARLLLLLDGETKTRYALERDLAAAETRIAAVLKQHQPEKRYQPHPDAEWSVSTAEEAADFDEIDIGDVTHFTVCRHCGQIEMRDDDDGRDYLEALWPCPTVRALTGRSDDDREDRE